MTTSTSKATSNRARLALIAVLVVAVAYLALWRPRQSQVSDLRLERDALSQELAGLAPLQAPPPASNDAGSEALAAAVPATDDLANLLRQFQQIAADTGVAQRNVATAQPVALTGVAGASIPVTITIAGPRAATLEYVRRLGVLPRLLVVDSVTFEPGGEPADGAGAPDATDAAVADEVQVDIAGRVFTTATPAGVSSDG
jgi:Tfp pilus assembly protein PilO